MRRPVGMSVFTFALVACLSTHPIMAAEEQTCSANEAAVQVLGSGGPFPSPRASTGYLIWMEGRSVLLIDTGGGVFQRFGEAGASFNDLDMIAISHLHPDHVSDLPALLWLTGTRPEPLRIVGPSGDDLFPSFDVFLDRLAGESESVFPILSRPANRGQGGGVPLVPTTIDVAEVDPTVISTDGEFQLSALGVPHTAPALAFRVSTDAWSVVFSSDQNGTNPSFIDFARDADVLIMHLSLSSEADEGLLQNHAPPSVVGEIAAAAGVGRLVLSHVVEPLRGAPRGPMFSAYDSETLERSVSEVRASYSGPLTVSNDLECVVLRP